MAAEEVLVKVTEEILIKLGSFVTGEINLAWGLKGDLEELGKKITSVKALLRDAEQRRVEEEFVRVWLEDVKLIAHDAEDVVDEFAFEVLRRELEIRNRMGNKVRNFFSISNPLSFRFKMAHKVNNINTKLGKIVQEADKYRLREVESNRPKTRLTHPFIEESEVVGRNDDIEKVVHMLLNSGSEEDSSIIAIVGLAGLGKTTLAKLVYKDETVKRHFDESMWVCVSDDFDVERLLKEMVESLTRKRCDVSNIEAIIKELRQNLFGKKYLLVLDDVWNTDLEKWECMRNSLLGIGASEGSKIMVTSRSEEVVSITMHIKLIYHLAMLSHFYSWILFEQRAFASGGAKKTPNLVDIGRRIVERCGGLPLAIKTLGGLMYSKKGEKEWLSIENSKIWECKGESDILPILRLSYDHLSPPSLKQCFTYCSIFPKDSTIEKEIIIQLWMAQGFLQPSQNSNLEMEDLGDEYFKILSWNSLFQDVELDEFGNITKYKMHDLVHDLAASISGSQCLSLESREVKAILKAQHLSIPRESAGKMRTLILRDDVLDDSLLIFKCLRVLNLKGTNICELPTSIGMLKHLRYLDISRTEVRKFPDSIFKLYNLQTLRFVSCFLLCTKLPTNLKNLINLRHICFGKVDGILWVPAEDLLYDYTDYLTPAEVEYDYIHYLTPAEMGRLTCLQTLPCFCVRSEKGYRIEELGCLNKLRGKLNIYNLEHVRDKEEAQGANLLEKENLLELGFKWSPGREGENNDEDVLEGLRPQPNLKSLTIQNYGGDKFPSWMTSGLLRHGNLVEIVLIDCNRCEQVPTLGQVPTLRVLKMDGMGNVKRIGAEFYGYGNDGASSSETGNLPILFPALKELSLRRMPNLVEWTEAAAGVGFPRLEQLSLEMCPRLTTVPSYHFSSLRVLSISGADMPLTNISGKLTTLTSLSVGNVSDFGFISEGLLKSNKNLASLTIKKCPAVTNIAPHGWACCTSLRSLYIEGCENLSHISDGLQTLTSLEMLRIVLCPNLISIPEDLRELRCLFTLVIWNCEKLRHLPKGLHCPNRLENLDIGPFLMEFDSFPNLEGVLQLRSLSLFGWPNLNSLPVGLQDLTALTYVDIYRFDGVEALPEWFGNLSSLQELVIGSCKNLKHLPPVEAMRRLTKLKHLEIWGCPLLEERCAKWRGREWSKIAHIPRIEIGHVNIRSQPAWRLSFLKRRVLRSIGLHSDN